MLWPLLLPSFTCLLGVAELGSALEMESLSREGWGHPCQEEGSHRGGLVAYHQRWIGGRHRSASCGELRDASSW
jgi:hypothetical protein